MHSSSREIQYVAAQQRPRRDEAGKNAKRHRKEHALERNAWSNAHENQRGVVSPLKKEVDGALQRDGEQNAEQCSAGGHEQTFGNHLEEQAAFAQANKTKNTDRL